MTDFRIMGNLLSITIYTYSESVLGFLSSHLQAILPSKKYLHRCTMCIFFKGQSDPHLSAKKPKTHSLEVYSNPTLRKNESSSMRKVKMKLYFSTNFVITYPQPTFRALCNNVGLCAERRSSGISIT